MPKIKFTTTLDSELLKQLKIYAIQNDKNVNNILEDLIIEFMDKQQKEQG